MRKFERRKTSTLIDWWKTLNHWEWPKGCPVPEEKKRRDCPRRRKLMEEIERELGLRVILGK